MTENKILDGIQVPADLRRLDEAELEQLSEELRYKIREVVSNTGGHLASNLGVVELTLALHRCFDFTTDRLLWDVGHQAYVHKLLTGRAKDFHTNRQKGGISGFPDPKESPYDFAKVGHSSTAISTGVGVAEGHKRMGQKRKTVVVVGDGALTGGMCFEGLINAGELKSDMLVVLNDNGNFIDAPVGSLHTYLDRIRSGGFYQHVRDRLSSVLKNVPFGDRVNSAAEHLEHVAHKLVTPGYIFEDLGFQYFGPVDGHDRKAVEDALARLENLEGPLLLHVVTAKGGGWEPAAKDPLTYHGPKGFDVDTGEFAAPKSAPKKTYSQVFAESMADLVEEDKKVVTVTAAMPTGTALAKLAKAHPDRVYDVGICEQHSFAFVEGLRITGMKPVLAHYSTFAQRGYDQLFQELVVQRDLGILVTLDRAGLVGEDGETHQGLYDIAWARCFPGVVLMAPKDGRELRQMINWAYEQQSSEKPAAAYLIRYPKENIPEHGWGLKKANEIQAGKAEVLRQGNGDLMVWAYGAILDRVWTALEKLGDDAERITLVNARFAKPFDNVLLKELAATHKQVMSVEDHALDGGFGSCMVDAMADTHVLLPMTRLGVRDELVAHASREEQMKDQGLDADSLATRMRDLLGISKAEVISFSRQA